MVTEHCPCAAQQRLCHHSHFADQRGLSVTPLLSPTSPGHTPPHPQTLSFAHSHHLCRPWCQSNGRCAAHTDTPTTRSVPEGLNLKPEYQRHPRGLATWALWQSCEWEWEAAHHCCTAAGQPPRHQIPDTTQASETTHCTRHGTMCTAIQHGCSTLRGKG